MGDDILLTLEQEKRLVQEVARNPLLYDSTNADYKNRAARDAAWRLISSSVNSPDSVCKKRWRSLRDTYKRQKRMIQRFGVTAHTTRRRNRVLDLLMFLDNYIGERMRTLSQYPCDGSQGDSDNSMNIETEALPTATVEYYTGYDKEDEQHTSACAEYMLNTNEETRGKTCPNDVSNTGRSAVQAKTEEDKTCQRRAFPERDGFVSTSQMYDSSQEDEIDAYFKAIAMTVKRFPPAKMIEIKSQIFNLVTQMEASLL